MPNQLHLEMHSGLFSVCTKAIKSITLDEQVNGKPYEFFYSRLLI